MGFKIWFRIQSKIVIKISTKIRIQSKILGIQDKILSLTHSEILFKIQLKIQPTILFRTHLKTTLHKTTIYKTTLDKTPRDNKLNSPLNQYSKLAAMVHRTFQVTNSLNGNKNKLGLQTSRNSVKSSFNE